MLPQLAIFFAGRSSGKKSEKIVHLNANAKKNKTQKQAAEFARLDVPNNFDNIADFVQPKTKDSAD
jgi:hypothetical protein